LLASRPLAGTFLGAALWAELEFSAQLGIRHPPQQRPRRQGVRDRNLQKASPLPAAIRLSCQAGKRQLVLPIPT